MPEKTFARFARWTAFSVLTLASTAAIFPQTPSAVLTIHADQPVSAVSPTIYGLMTEEINFSYDGGLDAEMVRNRTFRADWSGVLYWYLLENGNSKAKMQIDSQAGPSDALKS